MRVEAGAQGDYSRILLAPSPLMESAKEVQEITPRYAARIRMHQLLNMSKEYQEGVLAQMSYAKVH